MLAYKNVFLVLGSLLSNTFTITPAKALLPRQKCLLKKKDSPNSYLPDRF